VSNGLLIVDDNESMRSLIRAFVESKGYKVCGEAGDGIEAIKRAKELPPDLILLDLSMPRMNGAEAASVLKRLMPRIPIILFTMFEFTETLAKAVGVSVVLSKPDGIAQLERHLKSILPQAVPLMPITPGTSGTSASE
jgi:DNA-binding NarL/FixJ family response regulator